MGLPRGAIAILAAALVLVGAVRAGGIACAKDAPPRDVSKALEEARASGDVPGMAGAVVRGDRVVAIGVAGVRKRGGTERATVGDRWHLGSCTKSMTATLLAMLVEEKKLSWDSTLAGVFPDLASTMDAKWKGVTLELLVHHRAGAPANLDADGLWGRLWAHHGTGPEGRRMLLEGVVKNPPVSEPGTAFLYSNAGFAIAGAAAERVTKKAWEDLMRERLFGPLGMTSAGFGAPGKAGAVDEPWGHRADGTPVEPGPGADNPPAIGPAGTVHASIGDWAKYVALHLEGARGKARLIAKESFVRLHAPTPKAEPAYAAGWGVGERDWAGGRVLTHSGSNTMWFCVTWIAPEKGFAVLVACNRGGPEAEKACDRASWALIQDELAAEKSAR